MDRCWLLIGLVVAAGCGATARGGSHPAHPAPAPASPPGPASAPPPPASAPAASTSSAPLAAPPPRPDHGSGPGGCFTRDELAARQAQAKADNAATYAEALHRLGLAPAHLASHTLFSGTSEIRGPYKPAHVEERELSSHRRARVIVMPPTGGCGDLSKAFQFARGGDRIWLVKKHVKSRTIDVTLCGCPGCKCGKPSYGGCGGARIAATTILGYELPARTEFAGEREVPYIEDFVRVLRALPPQPVCKPVPPPP